MSRVGERRRVLVAAAVLEPMQDLFAKESMARWEILETDSFSLARFTLQYNPCDVLVVNDDLEAAVSNIIAIIRAEHQRVSRVDPQKIPILGSNI